MEVPSIRTPRLELVWLSPEFIRAFLDDDRLTAESIGGFAYDDEWADDTKWVAEVRLEQMVAGPAAGPWLLRAIVLANERRAIGHINFHGPPENGLPENGPPENGSGDRVVEIGYAVLPAHRRKGIALEAIDGMFGWAAERGVSVFRASVAPDNDASLALIAKLGFVHVGEQIDEIDGLELVYLLERT